MFRLFPPKIPIFSLLWKTLSVIKPIQVQSIRVPRQALYILWRQALKKFYFTMNIYLSQTDQCRTELDNCRTVFNKENTKNSFELWNEFPVRSNQIKSLCLMCISLTDQLQLLNCLHSIQRRGQSLRYLSIEVLKHYNGVFGLWSPKNT